MRWRSLRHAQGAQRDFPITFERRIWGRYDFFHLLANAGDTDKTRNIGQSPLFLCMKNLMLMVLIADWEQGSLDPGRLDALLLADPPVVTESVEIEQLVKDQLRALGYAE